MLIERTEIKVRNGTGADFMAVMEGRGMPIVRATPGVRWAWFGRGVENPGSFIILIEWETMESHVAFSQASIFTEFCGLFEPYSQAAQMEHFEVASSGDDRAAVATDRD